MEANVQKQATSKLCKPDEKILVVAKDKLFSHTSVNGFLPLSNFDQYEEIIKSNKQFLWRSTMETDVAYKQICPYLIFYFQDTFFVMQRKSSASEQRLKNKFTMGSGGHLRQEDVDGRSIMAWAEREFNEEIVYNGSYTIHPFGIVNDESDLVGQVHMGLVFLLKGDSDDIAIRSELKQGSLMTLEECEQLFDIMESWSQFIFPYLKQHFALLP